MVKVPKEWERTLIELAAAHGITDIITRGRLTKAETGIAIRILKAMGRGTARTAPRLAGTAFAVARRHPYIFAAALAYEGYIHRDEVRDVADDIRGGYDYAVNLVDDLSRADTGGGPAGSALRGIQAVRGSRGRSLGMPDLPEFSRSTPTPKKKISKFNKAVSTAMKVIKKSKSYGKPGTINNAKSAFKTATKTVSAMKKGRKLSKTGIKRKIGLAIKRFI